MDTSPQTNEAPEIVAGTNAQENWDIIKRSEPGHIWFHLNSFPSPHVIIRSENPGDQQIIDAAHLCKSTSKYKNIKNARVVYCRVANLEMADEVGAVNIISKRKCKFVTPE